ncbi:hypothetical protein DNW00_22435 [Salmonella enterica subsp. enterica serovar Neunkirchen]|nr:hypothetical protein [Salmonella enterica subsp. enterica serovar Neunkirchen]
MNSRPTDDRRPDEMFTLLPDGVALTRPVRQFIDKDDVGRVRRSRHPAYMTFSFNPQHSPL